MDSCEQCDRLAATGLERLLSAPFTTKTAHAIVSLVTAQTERLRVKHHIERRQDDRVRRDLEERISALEAYNDAWPPLLHSMDGVLHQSEVKCPSYVYFLTREGRVVYVGQTSAPWPQRISQHRQDGGKVFDDVWAIEVPTDELDATEKRLIKQYKPEYNISHNTERDNNIFDTEAA